MPNSPLFSSLLVAGALLAPLVTLGPVARAEEQPLWLFETQCVTQGSGRMRQEMADISVGREVFRSYMFMGPGSRSVNLTCKIRGDDPEEKENFNSLRLEFGMQDSDKSGPYNTVVVYLDGEESASQTIGSGEKVSIALDVSQSQNVSVETVCSSRNAYCDRVYFFNASLSSEPVPPNEPPTPEPSNSPAPTPGESQ
ncbi:MAG TPA: hypothetical protein IGS52_04440 [Oscillatoriaceae cyanobacterium M33_DOE_052]|uniref:Glycosyl hydrolase family 98 putative carbohydrate-binding module domain-containing protein n=1 Tax=Planktothricoides sp. SpSt-374 TaxID=2282167 RepID=A0A7C3VEP1_9CYAN|nr:hypothetical protein [Oscillatoriaceae cyanobacterium M33_DOE_052]